MPTTSVETTMRGLLRDIGAALRPLGFRGSGGIWRLETPEGVAVVQKQGSAGTPPGEAQFFLNRGVVPAAWWEFTGRGAAISTATEHDGIRLLERRMEWTDPAFGDRDRQIWRIAAGADIAGMRAHLLERLVPAARELVDLLAPDRYLDGLRAVPDKPLGYWPPYVVLLAAKGPSAELDAACAGLRAKFAERPGTDAYVDRIVQWASNSARSAR